MPRLLCPSWRWMTISGTLEAAVRDLWIVAAGARLERHRVGLGRCDDGPRARGDGRGGGEPAGDQPDAERQLEQSTGDGADEPGTREAEQLQQCARGDARVADETPDS